MQNRLEDRIRDYLAKHLDLLEEGLTFVDKEYKLPNPTGAGGSIDLLARDIFGHVVIIEIKRSNQAARQALNEIHKYTALFRIRAGLDESRIRLMVVSTEWHELLVPLSEFAEATAYPVEGISISASSDGTVSSAARVKLHKRVAGLKVSRAQAIYLYETAARRDEGIPRVIGAAQGAGIQDFAILRCDYTGADRRIVYPHASYFCFASPLAVLADAECEKLKASIEWEDGLDQPDENFIAFMNHNHLCDTFEIGYPEKLTNIRADWSVSVSSRAGRLSADASVLTDEEIIGMAQAVEGGSPIYLGKITSPRFGTSWDTLLSDMGAVLQGNAAWQAVVPRFLQEIKERSPDATIGISVYNPANLLMALYWIAWNGEYSKCPHLEIVVNDRISGEVRILVGFLAWNQRPVQFLPEEMMEQVYGGLYEWMSAITFHATHEVEDQALAAHNLVALTVEWRFKGQETDGPTQVTSDENGLSRTGFAEANYKPLTAFSAAHQPYLAKLKEYVSAHCAGLPGSTV